jgi:hypothetical protein
MPNFELTEGMFPEGQYEWIPLELSEQDVNKQIYGKSGSVYQEAIKAGQAEYKEQSEAYERSLQPTKDTPDIEPQSNT